METGVFRVSVEFSSRKHLVDGSISFKIKFHCLNNLALQRNKIKNTHFYRFPFKVAYSLKLSNYQCPISKLNLHALGA